MTKGKTYLAAGMLMAVLTFCGTGHTFAKEHTGSPIRNSKSASEVKISLTDAIAKVEADNPGSKVVSARLEDEDGKAAYSLELLSGKVEKEVTLDANTGTVFSDDND